MYILVAILLIIVVIFGVTSGMQSYATAQQAQAVKEVAQTAQINAWGNLIAILMTILVIIAILASIAAVIWIAYQKTKRGGRRQEANRQPRTFNPSHEAQQFTMNDLIQLKVLEMLSTMNKPVMPALPDNGSIQREEKPADDFMPWLR